MKDRLRELGQNTFGSKRVLWTRIQETERKIAEEVAYRAAIQREQEARTSGATSSSALPAPTLKKPSEFEQQIHDLTHTPAADWREFCVMGHGTEKLHKRVDHDKASPHPLILLNVLVTPTPSISQKYCRANGRRTAVQMGGVLQYKWEAYCWVSPSSRLRSQESSDTNGGRTAVQIGGVLPYFLRDQ